MAWESWLTGFIWKGGSAADGAGFDERGKGGNPNCEFCFDLVWPGLWN